MAPALGLLCAALIVGCRSPGSGPEGASSGRARVDEARPGSPASGGEDLGLSLELRPDPAKNQLLVGVTLRGPEAGATRSIAVARAWADTRGAEAIGAIEAHDARGPIAVGTPRDEGEDRVYPLDRPPEGGALHLRYPVRAGTVRSRFGLDLGADRVSAVGHAFLVLPRFEAPLPVRIHWALDALPAGARAAGSFGAGDTVLATATAEQLAHAVYLAGPIRVEAPLPAQIGELPPGGQLAVLGAPVFDSRAAFYWATTTFGAITGAFGDPDAARDPFWFLLIPVPGLANDHDGAYLHRSFGLWFDAARPFDAGLKSVVAHELTHRFLGGAVRLIDEQGREATWFSEGFTIHLARRMLVDGGLVTPADTLGDLRRIADDTEGESPDHACAAEQLGRFRGEHRAGARYAARVDAEIAARSHGARGLVDLVRALLARGKSEHREAFPTGVWRAQVVAELGAHAGPFFDRSIVDGAPIELPDGVFGPCFRRALREEPTFDLGFNRAGIEDGSGVIHSLVPGSAAERAGLREGALVMDARIPDDVAIPPGGAGVPEVTLTMAGRGKKRIRYRPIGTKRTVRWETRGCALTRAR